ncbi:hypothetical protein [Cellulophaga sp. Hel_I_12]|uniref:hypothetical protein n=1 Tax=Cellulophaga sp. Hel_I_12 TaxID=1249972 RepID=UPI0006487F71|nr:hypothetical protein [Cellulophaga sp. Hel_I_12]
MFPLKKQIGIAFIYFTIAAFFGVVLRLFAIADIPINYKFFVHTHSHIALLGWVYVAITTLLYYAYLGKQQVSSTYKWLFVFTQVTLIGMLLTFPFQGYALFSIIFSTLFLFASYWFTWFFIKKTPIHHKTLASFKMIKMALIYLVISSIGPWALGVIMTVLGPLSIWYRMAIYFYLHFLYNGWMLLTLVGLFMYLLEQHQILFSKKHFKFFIWILQTGIIATFFLSTLWTNPAKVFYVLGGIGALCQAIAFVFLGYRLYNEREKLKPIFSKFQKRILSSIAVLLGLKVVLQIASAFPYIANLAATYLSFTIGYLHLTFLGVVSLSLFFLLDYFKIFSIDKKSIYLYSMGFLGTEILIFYKGFVAWQKLTLFPYYFEALTAASFLIALSLLFITVQKSK